MTCMKAWAMNLGNSLDNHIDMMQSNLASKRAYVVCPPFVLTKGIYCGITLFTATLFLFFLFSAWCYILLLLLFTKEAGFHVLWIMMDLSGRCPFF